MESFKFIIKIINIPNGFFQKNQNPKSGNFFKLIVFIIIQGESKNKKTKNYMERGKEKG